MNKIKTKSFEKISQTQTVKFDPSKIKTMDDNFQTAPQLKSFIMSFKSLNLNGIEINQQDAINLDAIQKEIRRKLRSLNFQVGF